MRVVFWIVEYLASFIEIYMCSYFCGTFILKSEINNVKRKAAILSAIGAIVSILLNHIQLISHITTIVVILSEIIIQWICYRKKYLLSIGLVLAYVMLILVIDFVTIYSVALVTNTDTSYIAEELSSIRVACILLSKCLLIIAVITMNRLISREKAIPGAYIAIMGGCSAFLLLSNWGMAQVSFNAPNAEINNYTMLFFLASLGIEMIVFFMVLKIAEGQEQKQTNLLIELNNKMLQKSLDETEQTFGLWRQSIHDYKNHMIALTQLAEDEKIDEIKTYLKKENALIEKKMFYTKTGNSVVDAIIYTKQSIAEKQNITFVVNAKLPAEIIVSDMDMANILGNLIDNAIEAEQKEEEPYIEISIKQEKAFLIISIRNKCTKMEKLDISKTSKRDSQFHGIGLKSVKKLVKKYDGEISLDLRNQEFVVNIFIQNK